MYVVSDPQRLIAEIGHAIGVSQKTHMAENSGSK
jgi:hypothetical protein